MQQLKRKLNMILEILIHDMWHNDRLSRHTSEAPPPSANLEKTDYRPIAKTLKM